jgi:hypothetical protein
MDLKFCQEFSLRGIRLFEKNLKNGKILVYICNSVLLYKNVKTTLQEEINFISDIICQVRCKI